MRLRLWLDDLQLFFMFQCLAVNVHLFEIINARLMKQCHHERRLNRRMTILSSDADSAAKHYVRKFPKNARPSPAAAVKHAVI